MPNASHKRIPQASRGVTLLEMALAMMILAILSVAVSNLVRSGVEAQMSQRTHDNMQTIALNVVDDLRYDIRTASAATISGGGSRLVLTPVDGSSNITYELVGNDFRRVQPGRTTKVYNTGFRPQLRIACLSTGGGAMPCFEGWTTDSSSPGNMVASNTNPRQIRVNNITVQQLVNGNTLIDQNFGVPNFPIRSFAFDLMSATEFQ